MRLDRDLPATTAIGVGLGNFGYENLLAILRGKSPVALAQVALALRQPRCCWKNKDWSVAVTHSMALITEAIATSEIGVWVEFSRDLFGGPFYE